MHRRTAAEVAACRGEKLGERKKRELQKAEAIERRNIRDCTLPGRGNF